MNTRRSFIKLASAGTAGLVFAPAIVRASSLMGMPRYRPDNIMLEPYSPEEEAWIATDPVYEFVDGEWCVTAMRKVFFPKKYLKT